MAAAASSSSTTSCSRGRTLPIIASLVPFLLLVVASCPAALASATHGHGGGGGRKHAAARANHQAVFRAGDEREAYRRIMARMARMAKDSNMTIQVSLLLPVSYSIPTYSFVAVRAAGSAPAKQPNPPRCRVLQLPRNDRSRPVVVS